MVGEDADASEARERQLHARGGGGSRRATANRSGGGGDATNAKVLERLEAMASSMQSLQSSCKGIKEAQTGLERKVSGLKPTAKSKTW